MPPEAAEEGDRAEAEKAPGEKKVGQICDDVGQKWDEFYLLLCYTGYSKSQGLGALAGGCRKTQAFISLRVPPEARVRLPSWPQMASMVMPAGASIC